MMFYKELRYINEKRFSDREIDVIACIIHGKSAKAATDLLISRHGERKKITVKTFYAHVDKIKIKMDVIGQEGIIKFIENSDKYDLLRKHYDVLINRNVTEDNLQKFHDLENKNNASTRKNTIVKSVHFLSQLSPKNLFFIFTLTCTTLLLAYNFSSNFTDSEQFIRPDIGMPESLFVSRPSITKEIDNIFKKDGKVIIFLLGQQGSGKRELAIDYMKSNKNQSYWEIDARTKDGVRNSFRELAETLADTSAKKDELRFFISHTMDPDKAFRDFVKKSLKEKEPWCFLYSNVRKGVLTKQYLPDAHIIMTVDSLDVIEELAINQNNRIKIHSFTDKEKEKIFRNHLRAEEKQFTMIDEKKKIAQLLEHLDYPIYIVQAAKEAQTIGRIPTYDEFFKKFGDYNHNIRKKLEEILCKNSVYKKILLCLCLLDSHVSKKHYGIKKKYLTPLVSYDEVNTFLDVMQKNCLIEDNDTNIIMPEAIKEVCCSYLKSNLTLSEITEYLDDIINIVGSYDSSSFFFYDECLKEYEEKSSLLPHLKHLKQKIHDFKIFDKKKLMEYDIKLSLAILHCYKYFEAHKIIYDTADSILKLNNIAQILNDEDIAILLNICGNKCFWLENFEQSKKYLEQCISICKKNGFDYIQAFCNSDLARIFCKENNFEEVERLYNEADRLTTKIYKSKEFWLNAKITLFRKFCECHNAYYSSLGYYKSQSKCHDLIEKGIELLELDKSISYKKYSNNQYGIRAFFIKRKLASIYNKVGKYDEAAKYEEEAKNCLEAIRNSCFIMIVHKPFLEVNMGITLLRQNKLDAAYEKFWSCVNFQNQIQGSKYKSRALMYITEVLLRQNRFKEAYKYSKESIKCNTEITNQNKTEKAICYYNMAIIEYKFCRDMESARHFQEFFKIMRLLCRILFPSKIFEDFESKKVFNCEGDPNKIQNYLRNSEKVLSLLYGKSHPFVKDIVKKQLSIWNCLYRKVNQWLR